MTNEEQKRMIQFAMHISIAIDVYPIIMPELDRLNELSLQTKYKEMFLAKGKRKRELEKAYNEDRTRFKKRAKSFKKQLEAMVIKFDTHDTKFYDIFHKGIDEMYELDDKNLEKFNELLK